jgi:hypothetical protein
MDDRAKEKLTGGAISEGKHSRIAADDRKPQFVGSCRMQGIKSHSSCIDSDSRLSHIGYMLYEVRVRR